MQWTRASERLPDNEWSNGGYYDHIDDTFQPCVIRHDKGLGITITFPNGADIENPDLTKLRWLNDESPESSVWPGEEDELAKLIGDELIEVNGNANGAMRIATLLKHTWLQSRTKI